jgi:PD-(D/E)XK endonuclease
MAIAWAAIRKGIGVFRPLTDGERYDLIFDLRPRLVRVQCKWAVRSGDVIFVRAYSCRRTSTGIRRRHYEADEVDVIAAYCPDLDRCFYIPLAEMRGTAGIQLRLSPTANNQQRGIRWADDFDLERLELAPHGAVAQLGERLAGSQ